MGKFARDYGTYLCSYLFSFVRYFNLPMMYPYTPNAGMIIEHIHMKFTDYFMHIDITLMIVNTIEIDSRVS